MSEGRELCDRWIMSSEFRCRLLLLSCHVLVIAWRDQSLAAIFFESLVRDSFSGFLVYTHRQIVDDYIVTGDIRLRFAYAFIVIRFVSSLGLENLRVFLARCANMCCWMRFRITCCEIPLMLGLGVTVVALISDGPGGWLFRTRSYGDLFVHLCKC